MKKFISLVLLLTSAAAADTPPIIYQFAPPLVKTNNRNISIPPATSGADGFLQHSDWSLFNGKAPLASPVFTGVVTTPGLIVTTAGDSSANPGMTIVTTSTPNNGVPLDLNIGTGDLNDPFAGFGTANLNFFTGTDAEAGKSGDMTFKTGPSVFGSSAVPGNFVFTAAYTGANGEFDVNADIIRLNGNVLFNGQPFVPPTFVAPTVQMFNIGGTGGNYNRPTNPTPLYLHVRIIGPGGGGAGSSTFAGNNGGDGVDGNGNTTFSDAVAGFGHKATGTTAGAGGAGGSASMGSFTQGVCNTGNAGQNGSISSAAGVTLAGGRGGNGRLDVPNKGAGGDGATAPAQGISGSGGGSGGSCDLIIPSPAGSYTISVGVKGTGGLAGTSGSAGSNANDGGIIVEEYYQ